MITERKRNVWSKCNREIKKRTEFSRNSRKKLVRKLHKNVSQKKFRMMAIQRKYVKN
jgi:hypothetical protein